MAVLNDEQDQINVEKGNCIHIVEDNLVQERGDLIFEQSNGTESTIDDDGINNNKTESYSIFST
jgi:hypothetical protein